LIKAHARFTAKNLELNAINTPVNQPEMEPGLNPTRLGRF